MSPSRIWSESEFVSACEIMTAMYANPGISPRLDGAFVYDVIEAVRRIATDGSPMAGIAKSIVNLGESSGILSEIKEQLKTIFVEENIVELAPLIMTILEGDDVSQIVHELADIVREGEEMNRGQWQVPALCQALLPGYPEIAKAFVAHMGLGIFRWATNQRTGLSEFAGDLLGMMEMNLVRELMVREFGESESLSKDQWVTAAAVFRALSDKRNELFDVFPIKTAPRHISANLIDYARIVFPGAPLLYSFDD
jgi:hypothetical protein